MMKVRRIYLLSLYFIVLLPCISCVKDLDLDQVNDVDLRPVYEFDFVFSKLDTSQFVDADLDPSVNIQPPPIRDTLNYDLLSSDFIVDNLERIELTFEFSNTIERDFVFDLGFLNEAEQQIGPSFRIIAMAGNGEGSDPVITTEVIFLDTNDINVLGAATKVTSSIAVGTVNSQLQGVLQLRSKGTYFINYDL